MNPHEFCITDRFETDHIQRKVPAEFADWKELESFGKNPHFP